MRKGRVPSRQVAGWLLCALAPSFNVSDVTPPVRSGSGLALLHPSTLTLMDINTSNGLAIIMTSSVSIIIPAFNAERYLEEAARSALRQSEPSDEIIIVDDGSKDGTLSIAQDLASKHTQIQVMTQSNGGAAAARNAGLAKAKGEYLLFLDADDRLHENAVHNHLMAFKDHPEAAMVFGAYDGIDENGVVRGSSQTPIEDVSLEDLALRVVAIPSISMYKKTALIDIGGYDERFRQSQDVDLNLRLVRIGKIFSHGMKVADYRRHRTQVTNHRARTCQAHIDVLENNFGKSSLSPDLKLLKRAKAKLHSRFGYMQYRVALGALKRGHVSEARTATRLVLLRLKARFQGENWQPKRS